MENVLYLEKRGCDFWRDDEINQISDLQNYRLFCNGMELKDGKKIKFDVSRGARYDFTSYKQPKLLNMYKLYFDTYYEDEKGCWRLLEVEKKLHKDSNNYNYNSSDLLKAINTISKVKYTRIEILN